MASTGEYSSCPHFFIPPLTAFFLILDSKYNDVADWKWSSLLDTLNDGGKVPSESYTVTSKRELNELLDNKEFASAQKIQLVEVMMDPQDAPAALIRQTEMTGQGNAYGNAD